MLRRKGVDAAIVSDPRHVKYFTGYSTSWLRSLSILILAQGESYLFLGEARAAEAKKVYDGQLVTFENFALNKRMVAYPGFVAEEFSKFLRSERLLKGARKIGLEDWNMPYVYVKGVVAASRRPHFTGVTDMILSLRKTKGEDELRYIRRATERLELSYELARTHIAPGITELELCRDVMSDSILRYGPFEFTRGDTWISGERSSGRSGPPTNRMLRQGDNVILDLQAVANDYWADGARTYFVGKPNQDQKRLFQVILDAKKNAEPLLRPGTPCKNVYAAVAGTIEKAGFKHLFTHHAGHGLGLEDQEAPFFIPGSKERLDEGVVCTMEPGIYHPQIGGFRDEDTYIITKDGFEKITTRTGLQAG